tara:strand:+ start:1482 stop:1829 length:348 start_codon:yes stop_codon:yes gene_type:complete
MKPLIFITFAVFAGLVYVPVSQSANLASNICEYVAVDEKGRLRKLLKSNRLKLRNVFKDVSCDNDNILVFAAKKNAKEIGQLLIKKLPKDVIASELENLVSLSPQLAELAQARIN